MYGLKAMGAIIALCFMVSVPSFATKKRTTANAKQNTLYARLGGMKAIRAVVDDFVGRAAGDTRISKFFAKTASNPKQLNRFKKNLADQICQAAGGPCKYKGKDMRTAHAGMGVTETDFTALVEDLAATLDKFKVPGAEKNQLLGVLGPMKGEIISSADSNRKISSDAPEVTGTPEPEPMAPAPEN